jgi:putative oxidoreductase
MMNQNLLLFVLRMCVGVVFSLHGSQKVFGWFGGSGLSGWVNYMNTMHIPSFLAYTAAFFELLGGLMLVLGIACQIGGLMAACIMIGAIYLVHWPHGFFVQNNGFEYSLLLLILSLLIVVYGPGKWYLWDPFINMRI